MDLDCKGKAADGKGSTGTEEANSLMQRQRKEIFSTAGCNFTLGCNTAQKKNTMWCKICKEINLENAMALGTDNFRTSTLKRHVERADHTRALSAPKEEANMKKV